MQSLSAATSLRWGERSECTVRECACIYLCSKTGSVMGPGNEVIS